MKSSFFRFFFLVCLAVVSVLIVIAVVKKRSVSKEKLETTVQEKRFAIDLSQLTAERSIQKAIPAPMQMEISLPLDDGKNEEASICIEHPPSDEALSSLFEKPSICPIVQTIPYTSKVPWKHQKSAWLIDYATHYTTPLGFLCKSIFGSYDTKNPSITEGQLLNVYRNDIQFYFHAVVCLSSCTMRLYYVLPSEKKATFLKKYAVCLGRKDPSRTSGYLTPTGVYQLGSRTCIYQPRNMGIHKGKKVEMIQVFGTHWIPFEKEISDASMPAKGYGIHGTPIVRDEQTGALNDDNRSIGSYESDGCIRLANQDVLEFFSLVSSRKTYVEIVLSFQESKLFSGEL